MESKRKTGMNAGKLRRRPAIFKFDVVLPDNQGSLRHISGIFLLIALLGSDLSRPMLYADYLMNLVKYKEACINKARPALQCNGKCQMVSKMNANSKEEDVPDAPQKPKNWPFSHSSKSFFPQTLITPEIAYGGWHSLVNEHYRFSHIPAIFHPPGN